MNVKFWADPNIKCTLCKILVTLGHKVSYDVRMWSNCLSEDTCDFRTLKPNISWRHVSL